MFDLGRTFLAAVERSSDATAITDGEQRLGYAAWYEEIAHLAGGLTALGLRRGDRLAVILQNRLEMASLHWACQFAGIVVTPLNWRIKPEELDYCLADSEATAIVFDDVAADTVAMAVAAQRLPRVAIGNVDEATCRFEDLQGGANPFAPPWRSSKRQVAPSISPIAIRGSCWAAAATATVSAATASKTIAPASASARQ